MSKEVVSAAHAEPTMPGPVLMAWVDALPGLRRCEPFRDIDAALRWFDTLQPAERRSATLMLPGGGLLLDSVGLTAASEKHKA